MKQQDEKMMFKFQQARRVGLLSIQDIFRPSCQELEKAKRQFFARGGVIRKLQVTRDSTPAVWGDFVKARSKVS